MKLTRRQLVATLAPAAVFAQNPTTPATPADELKAAQSRLKANSDALTKMSVPMDTEPAFQFHS
jgi:hypothetical protein